MKLPLNVDLTGKVAVVTGAGGVLCSVLSKAIAQSGAKVALLGHRMESLAIVEKEIREEGYVAKAYVADVLDPEALAKAHEEILKDFGTCDILINGAGGNNPKATTANEQYEQGDKDKMFSFFDLDKKGVSDLFDLNFLGAMLPTQEFAKDMVEKEYGNIINISSMNAYTPLTKIPAYSAAKAGISNFTEWLATHFAKVGIRTNAIAPGFFVSKQNKALLFDEEGNPTARTKKILAGTPMGRFGEAEELVGATLFLLCDDASSFVNGVVIPVDGAFHAYSGV